ncbi:ribonuclease domain-containing protein [Aerococcus tenax]|uniref:ribonuclease domain-containing protein n=1 Tax=Aerococcus tenax TaxID=3078812 RepID=UPI0018A779A4|nr:ribonuclease domain-containing protein [Aerococcus tenax]
MKRFLTFLLTGVLAFCLAGCQDLNQVLDQVSHQQVENQVEYGQVYRSDEEVSAYLNAYQELPPNYITKKEAQAAGWESDKGNLWEVTDKKTIGGDHFGNFEKKLPADKTYREADVNYYGGYRGDDRLVYSSSGDIYYTDDHYQSFKQLY